MTEQAHHKETDRIYPYREGNHYYPDPDTCLDLPTGIKRSSPENNEKEEICSDEVFWLTPPTTSTFTRTTTEAKPPSSKENWWTRLKNWVSIS